MKYLILLLLSGCSLTVQIDTDYASQNRSDGEIQEKVTTESTASPTVDASLEVDGETI
ncbi:hypothetical protein VPHK437A_0066 [Vibrio phage K437a]